MHGLRLPQLVVEEPHAVLDLANLAHKPANTQWSNMKHHKGSFVLLGLLIPRQVVCWPAIGPL